MGSIYRRPGSQNLWIKYARGRKIYRESVGSPTLAKAKRLLQLREGALAKGDIINPKVNKITFEDAVADVVRDYRVRGNRSLAHVERRVTLHLLPVFEGRLLAHLTTQDLRAYVDARLEAGASVATCNRELAIIRRAFTLAQQAGTVTVRPHVPLTPERNARQGFFERDQFEAVRRHLLAPIQPVVTFAYLTGWRIPSEVLPLQWKQVDEAHQVIRLEVGTTKNDAGREFPYGAITELRETIAAQARERDTLREAGRIVPHVFHRNGLPIKTFHEAWRAACKKAGCPGRIPHDLRRTAVRNLVRSGVSEQVAMRLTGHKTRAIFDRYDIVSSGDLRDAAAKLNMFTTAATGR